MALRYERVAGDIDVLARAGLPLETFLSEAVDSIERAIPWDGACVGTHDPATRILTSARKYGDLEGKNDGDQLFGLIEYGAGEPTSYHDLVEAGVRAVGMQVRHGGDVKQSERMRRLMIPSFGYHDEARVLFHDGQHFWGGLALFRGSDEPAFAEEEIAALARLSESLAFGLRGGLLAELGRTARHHDGGPAVVIVDAADEIAHVSAGAKWWLDVLGAERHSADPLALISSLAGAARLQARGQWRSAPRARVRTSCGLWLLMQASMLSGVEGHAGEVVVTIEEARPPEIVALVVAAFDLTPRERDVVQLVIQGLDTKEIAATLHLSPYTVQDHLKSVFEKADVRSRRELIARVYFDQYVPRMGQPLAPSGWFAPA